MYRKHKSALPANNQYLQHKWDMLSHEDHLHRIRTIKPCIDQTPPRAFMHLSINSKRIQAEQERICEIQRENDALTKRVAAIMKGAGYVDHRNVMPPKSLNCRTRQNEMLTLAFENMTINRRLRNVKSEYNHNKLEDSYLIQQKYKANILKYPQNWKELMKEEEIMRQKIRQNFLKKEKAMEKGNKKAMKESVDFYRSENRRLSSIIKPEN